MTPASLLSEGVHKMTAELMTMVIGPIQPHTRAEMQAAAQRAGAQCIFVSEVSRALALLRTLETPPRCIFASLKADLATLAEKLRDSVEYYTIPLVGLVPFPSSDFYQMANRQGADDSLPEYDTGGMTRRLANLVQGEAPRLPETRSGRALVAVSDEKQRRHVGRRLRSAGYEVEFISGAEGLVNSRQPVPAVLVATPSFAPLDETHGPPADATFPRVNVPRSTDGSIESRELSDPEIADRLMFLVDEATRPVSPEARASRRIQFSTITTFRAQRSFEHTYALTDNISRQGLYLRTLDPPPVGIYVQVNLRDKFGDVIEIRGTVAWRYAPNRVGGRICPGFGLSIDERACPPDDLEKYRALYAEALAQLEEIEKQQGNQLPSVPARAGQSPSVSA
jgi:hypothetical protein